MKKSQQKNRQPGVKGFIFVQLARFFGIATCMVLASQVQIRLARAGGTGSDEQVHSDAQPDANPPRDPNDPSKFARDPMEGAGALPKWIDAAVDAPSADTKPELKQPVPATNTKKPVQAQAARAATPITELSSKPAAPQAEAGSSSNINAKASANFTAKASAPQADTQESAPQAIARCYGTLTSPEFNQLTNSKAAREIEELRARTQPDLSPASEGGKSFLLVMKLLSSSGSPSGLPEYRSMTEGLSKARRAKFNEQTARWQQSASVALREQLALCLRNDAILLDPSLKEASAPLIAENSELGSHTAELAKVLGPVFEENYRKASSDGERRRVAAQQKLLEALSVAIQNEAGEDALRDVLIATSTDPLWNNNNYLVDEVKESLAAVVHSQSRRPTMTVASINSFDASLRVMEKWARYVRSAQ